METIVYRKTRPGDVMQQHTGQCTGSVSADSMANIIGETGPLSPEVFYPAISEQEMVTWTHWLPTCLIFNRSETRLPSDVTSTLTYLKAPTEVLEEFQWAWKLDLFEAYEVRTPVRRDVRDPLLLGRAGDRYYRLALWGESLLPLEQITGLVQQSLSLRQRAERYRLWAAPAGALAGLALGLPLLWFSPDGQLLDMSIFFASVGACLAWLPTFLYTPENRQHDFLDRYRC